MRSGQLSYTPVYPDGKTDYTHIAELPAMAFPYLLLADVATMGQVKRHKKGRASCGTRPSVVMLLDGRVHTAATINHVFAGDSEQLHPLADAHASPSVVARRLVRTNRIVHKRARRLRWQRAVAARARVCGIAMNRIDRTANALAMIARRTKGRADEGAQHGCTERNRQHSFLEIHADLV